MCDGGRARSFSSSSWLFSVLKEGEGGSKEKNIFAHFSRPYSGKLQEKVVVCKFVQKMVPQNCVCLMNSMLYCYILHQDFYPWLGLGIVEYWVQQEICGPGTHVHQGD